jgi:hypothetical protein
MAKKWIALLLSAGLVLLLAGAALATAQGYIMNSWTVDGGGGQSAGGGFALRGAIGQPDTGVLTGGAYVLQGGFFTGLSAASSQREIFLPVVVR